MRWRPAFLIGGIALLILGAIFVTLIQKNRANQNLVYSINNVRELSQFVQLHTGVDPTQGASMGRFQPTPLERLRELKIEPIIPAGTVAHPTLPPEERLSWLVPLLPSFTQSRQDTTAMHQSLDVKSAWNFGPNLEVSRKMLKVVVSASNPILPVEGEPAVTQYLGVAGIGTDGPMLPTTDPRSGAFRYDKPTDFTSITDGISSSILFAEASTDLGPWLRGGPASLRSLDVTRMPYLGVEGQFGGNQPAGTIFGMADGSVRVLTDRTDRAILHGLITITGAKTDPMPGE
jgi:Protein of unknown function (DUF1559)